MVQSLWVGRLKPACTYLHPSFCHSYNLRWVSYPFCASNSASANGADNNSTYFAGLFYGLNECVKSGHWKHSVDLMTRLSQGRAPDRMGGQWCQETRITPRFLVGEIMVPFTEIWVKEARKGFRYDEFTFESPELSFLKTFNYCFYQHLLIARYYLKCCTWIISVNSHNNPIKVDPSQFSDAQRGK